VLGPSCRRCIKLRPLQWLVCRDVGGNAETKNGDVIHT